MSVGREGDGRAVGVGAAMSRNVFAGLGLLAMMAAFVLDFNGISRLYSGVILFSGVVLFSSGIGESLSGLGGRSATRSDARQALWYGKLGAMPLAALLVALFVGRDVWALVSGEGEVQIVWLVVAAALIGGSFFELVLFRLRPLLDEELTRAYATAAMVWGFVAGFIGAAVVLGLMVMELRVGVMALLPMMAVMVWVAGLRLFWLMRGADEG